MKILKNVGLVIFLIGIFVFSISGFLGKFYVESSSLSKTLEAKLSDRAKANGLVEIYKEKLSDKTFSNTFAISSIVQGEYNQINKRLKDAQDWDNVMYDKPNEWSYAIIKSSPIGLFVNDKGFIKVYR